MQPIATMRPAQKILLLLQLASAAALTLPNSLSQPARCTRCAAPRCAVAPPPVPADCADALALCKTAAATKQEDGEAVVDALLALESGCRKAAKEDPTQSPAILENLNGAWRLIFTTGTVSTQEKLGGNINYFPIKAQQCFETSTMKLTNGIYLGDFALLKFYGTFDWLTDRKKLEFDFDRIAVLGLGPITLPGGGAAEIGAKTGLGAESNVDRAKSGKKAFFNWIWADGDVALARGGGGGLALWRRDPDSEMEMEPPEKEGDEFKLPELPDFGKLLGGLLGDDK